MSKKMLIDATHPEETRVVVADGTKVEEFDFESSAKRQLAGNIYLAKITRVEPSLQAAFVEYGGNRHGFLAFSEIHPDYYQIPVADREALVAAEEAAQAEEEAEERRRAAVDARKAAADARKAAVSDADAVAPATETADAETADAGAADAVSGDAEAAPETAAPVKKKRTRAPRRRKDAAPAAEAPAAAPAADSPAADAIAADAAPADAASAAEQPSETGQAAETTPAAPSADEAQAAAATALADAPAPVAAEDAPAPVAAEDAPVATAADDAPDAAEDAPPPDEAAPRGPSSIAEGAGAGSADTISEDYAPDEANGDDPEPEAETASTHTGGRRRGRGRRKRSGGGENGDSARPAAARGDGDAPEAVETVGASDAEEDIRPRRAPRGRSYKIQEVIKVRQIMLVQVVKEERGNKGAALTTYLSLAGRYCVLMPNTARGGGISRKITSAEDRKKLKEIAAEFEVPKGMGIIIRTAGSQRTRAEIRRDFEYLLRQWEDVRDLTLKSVAPTLIYEEGSLIKRSIRDLYTRDIDEVLVEGEDGYREAKDYMRMLMPSHAKNVKLYAETVPLFSRYQVENYLAAMFNPTVQLKSGGYIVIGVTEALVAIDVNSGRSTREGSIEETALKTNLEAADEVARQLRLRDLAGLIVIDFIDMDERRNNAAVEKRMKDRLSSDRARIQVGRISAFGLMEMSRQRLRPGMIEASTAPCPHCHGTGLIRSENSLALSILREVEEEGMRKRAAEVKVVAPVSVANFIINDKRDHLIAIESRYGLSVLVEADPTLISPEHRVERLKTASRALPPSAAAVRADSGFAGLDDPRDAAENDDEDSAETAQGVAGTPADRPETDDPDAARAAAKRRRGRRGGRKRRREDDEPRDPLRVLDAGDDDNDGASRAPLAVSHTAFGDEIGDAPEMTSLRRPETEAAPEAGTAPAATPPETVTAATEAGTVTAATPPETVTAATPPETVTAATPPETVTAATPPGADAIAAPVATAAEPAAAAAEEDAPKPKRRRTRKTAAKAGTPAEDATPADAAPADATPAEDAAPADAAPAEGQPAEAPIVEAAAVAAPSVETPVAETPTAEAAVAEAAVESALPDAQAVEPATPEAAGEPATSEPAASEPAAPEAASEPAAPQPEPAASAEPAAPKRRGWWSLGAR